jgi:hypothetical protein
VAGLKAAAAIAHEMMVRAGLGREDQRFFYERNLMCGAHKILSAYTVGKISNAPSANIKGTTADIVEEKKKTPMRLGL